MEGNKDSALECLGRAEKHAASGNIEAALKFVQKSLKMYPTDRAQALLDRIQSQATSGAGSSRRTSSDSSATSTSAQSTATFARRRNVTGGSTATDSSTTKSRPYTPKQASHVQRVLSTKCFYERLGVEKTADGDTIRKAYRKLAVQLHPDKNSAPKADEAFKAINKAWEVLSDEQKRRRYDVIGEEDTSGPSASPFQRQVFTPEDLLAEIFSGRAGFTGPYGARFSTFHSGPSPFHSRHQQRRRTRNATEDNYGQAPAGFNLFPLLAVFLLAVLLPTLLQANRQLYSFRRTATFSYERSLSFDHEVKYYVSRNFDEYMPRRTKAQKADFFKFELGVDAQYQQDMAAACQQQQFDKSQRIHLAKRSGNPDRIKRAEGIRMTFCEELQSLRRRRQPVGPDEEEEEEAPAA